MPDWSTVFHAILEKVIQDDRMGWVGLGWAELTGVFVGQYPT